MFLILLALVSVFLWLLLFVPGGERHACTPSSARSPQACLPCISTTMPRLEVFLSLPTWVFAKGLGEDHEQIWALIRSGLLVSSARLPFPAAVHEATRLCQQGYKWILPAKVKRDLEWGYPVPSHIRLHISLL